jgi:hypothetical protein
MNFNNLIDYKIKMSISMHPQLNMKSVNSQDMDTDIDNEECPLLQEYSKDDKRKQESVWDEFKVYLQSAFCMSENEYSLYYGGVFTNISNEQDTNDKEKNEQQITQTRRHKEYKSTSLYSSSSVSRQPDINY